MGYRRSILLTLKFEVRADCDCASGFEAELVSIEPKSVFHTDKQPVNEGGLQDGILGRSHGGEKQCLNCEYQDGEERAEQKYNTRSYYLCDACAVEDTIANIGAEHWLELANIELREGTLVVSGNNTWSVFETLDGTDYDEEFEVQIIGWHEA